jgi:hypothetical protein
MRSGRAASPGPPCPANDRRTAAAAAARARLARARPTQIIRQCPAGWHQVGVPGLAVKLAQLGAMSAHASRVISSVRCRCRAVNT